MSFKVDTQTIGSSINFSKHIYDMRDEDMPLVREQISKVAEELEQPKYRGPFTAIVQELVGNGLKAVYKKIYFEHIFPLMGLGEPSYEEKLEFFRVEIESHQTKNFGRLAHEESLYVTFEIKATEQGVEFFISNPGEPSEIEMHRITSFLKISRDVHNLKHIFEDSDDDQKNLHEGAGLGLSLIIMTMRNLGIHPDNFNIYVEDNKTNAKIIFPWILFFSDKTNKIELLNSTAHKYHASALIKNLGYYIFVFDNKGEVISVSPNFLPGSSNKVSKDVFHKLIPEKLFTDLFNSKNSIYVHGRIDNYRITIELPEGNSGKQKVLFNICGVLNMDSTVTTLWIPVVLNHSKENSLSEGRLGDSIKLHTLLKTYLPQKVLKKAHETVEKGDKALPEEIKNITIFFADIVDFTRKAEQVDPRQAIDLLNIALRVLVQTIEKTEGYIDKFMGDGIMAIFENPLNAIIASVEVQMLFKELNEFRSLSSQDAIELRIGIHTGEVMMGNIGTYQRREWTAIGDVVNTAARLEKSAFTGSILISGNTYNAVKGHVEFERKGILKPKGKKEEVQVYFIKSVTFEKSSKKITLDLAE